MRRCLPGLFLFAFLSAGFADDATKLKFTITGELDVGATYDTVAGTTTDWPTWLKLCPTLVDGNVGINSRLFFLPPTDTDTAIVPTVWIGSTRVPVPISVDYAYGWYLLYGSLFDHFMTAKISIGDFADLKDYVLTYNSNFFTNYVQGNPIGGYIEGLTGAELALNPITNLTLAVFVPWDDTGSGQPRTFAHTDVNISYTYPKVIKINSGYGNSYNGDVSGVLIQPTSGTNLYYVNVSLLAVKNLSLGSEYGNYFNVSTSSPLENYFSGTVSYSIPDEKTGNSLTFSDDIFYFVAATGTNVIQEYFTTVYTFSQVFSGADVLFDLDVDYANNYPGIDSTSPGNLVATHENVTISPWIKLSLGTKSHILALGYAYNYDLNASRTAYNKFILSGTIYF
jgi:hypothetical protein